MSEKSRGLHTLDAFIVSKSFPQKKKKCLLIGHENRFKESENQAKKFFLDDFFQTFALQTNVSTNHNESHPSPATSTHSSFGVSQLKASFGSDVTGGGWFFFPSSTLRVLKILFLNLFSPRFCDKFILRQAWKALNRTFCIRKFRVFMFVCYASSV